MKITILYKFRRALTLGAIAGGALVACNKENIIPTRDVELVFGLDDVDNITIENIKTHTNMPDVRYVYMITKNDKEWHTCTAGNIQNTRRYLEPRIAINPQKVRGKGNFCFKPGEASKIPQDSLWFIQNGWTINQKQK